MFNKSVKKYQQFFTTNYNYILQNFVIPLEKINTIIEPFVGNGDLIKYVNEFLNNNNNINFEYYDIDVSLKNEILKNKIIFQDTIKNPPLYKDKFVITNPPYLARNKSNDKLLFNKYNVNDLYKCFIVNLINDPPIGGIIVIPLNFWLCNRKCDINLRKKFLEKFIINHLNIFEEQVFDDTTYTVCSFQFTSKNNKNDENNEIKMTIYPSKIENFISLNEKNDYMIGSLNSILNKNIKNEFKIDRLTKNNYEESKKNKSITNILVKCIDDSKNKQISMSFVKDDEICLL